MFHFLHLIRLRFTDKYSPLPLSFSNAGFTNDKMLHTCTDEVFEQMYIVHQLAPHRLIRAAAPYMRVKEPEKRENRSVIFVSNEHHHFGTFADTTFPLSPRLCLQVSSTSGTHGNVGQINYSAAKSAVVGMTKSENLDCCTCAHHHFLTLSSPLPIYQPSRRNGVPLAFDPTALPLDGFKLD
jgi:NAD(P)-dependent dehydrogenase (short-subunit alcohol dehydrogenase family)